jgi:hypothetical protein
MLVVEVQEFGELVVEQTQVVVVQVVVEKVLELLMQLLEQIIKVVAVVVVQVQLVLTRAWMLDVPLMGVQV